MGPKICATALIFFSATGLGDTISLRADSWCPYSCDPAAAKPGFMIEIAKRAFEPAGHKLDYKILNWARAIAETRGGKFTGIVGAAKSDAPDFIYPDIAQAAQTMCFFTNNESTWKFESAADLGNILLGAIKDYTYSPEVDEHIKTNLLNPKKIDLVGSENPMEINYKKLLAKRIGAFIDDREATNTYVKSLDATTKPLRIAGCVPSSDLFIAFSPKDPKSKQYAKLVGDRITAMRKDGSLKALLDNYGVDDWKK